MQHLKSKKKVQRKQPNNKKAIILLGCKIDDEGTTMGSPDYRLERGHIRCWYLLHTMRSAKSNRRKFNVWVGSIQAHIFFGIRGAQFNKRAIGKLKPWETRTHTHTHLRKIIPHKKEDCFKTYFIKSSKELNELRTTYNYPHATYIQNDRYFDTLWRPATGEYN